MGRPLRRNSPAKATWPFPHFEPLSLNPDSYTSADKFSEWARSLKERPGWRLDVDGPITPAGLRGRYALDSFSLPLQAVISDTCGVQCSKSDPLGTGDALVHQDLNFDAPVLCAPGLGLVRCRRPVLAHRARRYDMPHGHATLLEQIHDHRFSAVLT